jgi:D-glycero-D-manno-heptose 1,7-bisphosphate phosphatase
MTPLVILDRDGVINEESDQYIKSPSEWIPIPGSLHAISRLNKAGYRVAVATNQEAVSRGLFDAATLQRIHSKMHQAVTAAGGRLDAIYFCPHGAEIGCDCRKPKPGMLIDCMKRFDAEPAEVAVVGDTWRDMVAAQSAGCQAILVRTGNGQRTIAESQSGFKPLPSETLIFDNLEAWVVQFLSTKAA